MYVYACVCVYIYTYVYFIYIYILYIYHTYIYTVCNVIALMLFIEAEPAIHGIVCSTDSICTNSSLIATKSARKPQNTESQIKRNNSLL